VKQFLFASLLITVLMANTKAWAQVRVGYGAPQAEAPAPATNAITDYANPKEYVIGGLTLTGTRFLDPNSLISLTGLKKGDKIRLPGEAQGSAIRKLMDSGLLFDVVMSASKVEGSSVWLLFKVVERPRLFQITYTGVRKGESESLKEKVKLTRGKIITNTDIKNAQLAVRKYYVEKGYLNAKVKVTTIPDSTRNNATMRVQITKGEKVKIDNIEFAGREEVSESALRGKMKGTKQMRFGRVFSPSKFIPKKFEEDQGKLVEYYNKLGYRDAVVEKDSVINSGGATEM
jgi:outer membrane protein insertion porin family